MIFNEENLEDFTQENLSQLKLRGVLAFAARCTRRVFPLLAGFEKIKEFNAAIALAEDFARGKVVYPTQAGKIAASAKHDLFPTGGSPREPIHNNFYVMDSAYRLGLAAADAFSAITNTPPKINCSEKAFEHTKEAVEKAILVTEPYRYKVDKAKYEEYAREHKHLAKQAEWVREVIWQDLENLKESHRGNYKELGMAIDTGKDGPLGSLWLEKKIPNWYREKVKELYTIRKLDVRNFDTNTLIRIEKDSFPDLLCWKITSDSAHSETILEDMKAVQKICRTIDRPPPGFVVFAPNLEEPERRKLIIQGATVYINSAQERGVPYDVDSLREQLEASYVGWVEQEPGMWTYSDGFPPHDRQRPQEKKATDTSDKQDNSVKPQETVTEEHYKRLIDHLQSESWWSTEY